MKRIKIFDTTLRDGEQSPGCSMNLTEKIEMARQLEKLGVDVIEAGFAIASPMDHKSVQAISAAVTNCTVASLARCAKGDIDAAWDAVKEANHPRIHVFLATSDIHMEYKLKMTREQVIDRIREMVAYAKNYCDDIEFSAEDASRSDWAFLAHCYSTAVAAGATTLNVPDTVGYSTPQEMYDLITYLRENIEGVEHVDISVHCHNDLGMAVANSPECVRAGATQVECTVNGIGERAGNASLEEIVMALRTRKDFYDAETGVNTKQIYRSSKLLSNITGVPIPPSKAIVGANAFAHESGIHQHGVIANARTYEIMNSTDVGIPQNTMVLGKHSGKHAFAARLKEMGYELPDEELARCFEEFKVLCDKKKNVTDQDILAIVTHSTTTDDAEVDGYKLMWFAVHTSNMTTSTSVVRLELDGQQFEAVCSGDGPVDAAFEAIDQIIRPVEHSFDLYRINSISPGKDTMGDVSVKLSCDNRTFSGRGLHTNIVEASVRAYISAMNKLRAYAARRAKGEV